MNPNFWHGHNILVTGGTGLVGSHVVEKLLECGAHVIVPYRHVDPRSYFVTQGFSRKVVMAQCDVKNYQRVLDLISKYEIEHIFHLAAQPIVTVAHLNPRETLETNIMGTVNILEAARHCPHVRGIVVASSDKAYGRSEVLPYLESFELRGGHPYNVSKSAADLIATTYHKTYGLPVVVTRFGNIYGAGDLNFTRIIPGAILAGLNNHKLKVRSDGAMLREYVYVKDVADGYLLLAENIEKVRGEAFNFGSGERYNVLDVVRKVGESMQKEIAVEILDIAENEIEEQYLSFEKVNRLLAWAPKYSLLAALPETVYWYQKVFGLKQSV